MSHKFWRHPDHGKRAESSRCTNRRPHTCHKSRCRITVRGCSTASSTRARPGNDGFQRTVTLLPILLSSKPNDDCVLDPISGSNIGRILSHLVPILRQVLGPGLNEKAPPRLYVYAVLGVTLIQVCYWLNQRWVATVGWAGMHCLATSSNFYHELISYSPLRCFPPSTWFVTMN